MTSPKADMGFRRPRRPGCWLLIPAVTLCFFEFGCGGLILRKGACMLFGTKRRRVLQASLLGWLAARGEGFLQASAKGPPNGRTEEMTRFYRNQRCRDSLAGYVGLEARLCASADGWSGTGLAWTAGLNRGFLNWRGGGFVLSFVRASGRERFCFLRVCGGCFGQPLYKFCFSPGNVSFREPMLSGCLCFTWLRGSRYTRGRGRE